MLKKSGLLLKFGLTAVAALTIIVASSFLVNYRFLNNILNRELLEKERGIYLLFQELITRDKHMLAAALDGVGGSPVYKKAFLEQDREGLYAAALPLFETMKREHGITHWYFIEPDGRIFLRVHRPDQYGDTIETDTFRRTQESGTDSAGLELGKTAFALRSFLPWYDGGTLIGYLEMGQEIEHVVATFKDEHGADYAVFGDREFIDKEQLSAIRREHGLAGSVDGLTEHVLISESSTDILRQACISEENLKKAETGVINFIKEIRASGRGCAGFPMFDVNGDDIGVVMFSFDISDLRAEFAGRAARTGATLVVFYLIIAAAMAGIFARMVARPLRRLDGEIRRVTEGDLKTGVAVRSEDEIGRLGRDFNAMVDELRKKDEKLRAALAGMQATIEERTRAVRDSEERYRTLIDSAQICIKIVGRDRKVITINPYGKAEHFIEGKDPEEIRNFDYMGCLKEEHRDAVMAAITKAFEGKTTSMELEHEPGTSKNDSCFSILSPVRNSRGEIDSVLFLSSDISERKLAERRIGELDALKNTFIQIVAHQLRTPMNAIRWNLESLLGDDLGKLKKEQKEFIRVTYEANNEVIARIRDLLTALDIEEGRVVLNRQETALDSLWNGVMTGWKKRCDVKGLACTYAGPTKPLPAITADADKLRDVFAKLADNATSYTAAHGMVDVSLSRRSGRIRFEIKDTGIGIPAVEQPRIFTRFFRASNASTMKPDASGLGLFIAKHFIEQHNGSLGFESEEGKGSLFWFEIPIKQV